MSPDLLVINGPGVVARHGEAVLWAESSDLRRESLLAAVIAAMAQAAAGRAGPAEFAAWLVSELAGPRGATVPALAFAQPDGADLLTVVHGWGRVTTPRGTVTATGSVIRIPAAWPIAIGRADLAVLATGDSLLTLIEGSVPGGAALVQQHAAAAEAAHLVVSLREPPEGGARAPLPVATPGDAADPDAADPDAADPDAAVAPPVPGAPRRPLVPGVRCSREHFNNPQAQHCRVCGIALTPGSSALVDGERPPLGVLVCDDGATYGLDGDYAIGSDPHEEPGVRSGLAQPLILGDLADGVAPTHVLIHVDGWDVHALNRSPNLPAAVLNRGDTQWIPLPPGRWARLAPGGYVGFAGRHVIYESNYRS